jgi:ribosomal-protein-alanine N-acetyltransferase
MRIRPYSPTDLLRLHAIDRAAFEPALAWSLAELRSFLTWPRSCTLVAEDDSEIVGFVCGTMIGPRSGHVATLDVMPDRQRRGLGGQLLGELEAWLWDRGAQRIRLETSVDPGGARAFYERFGYVVLERLSDYYGRRRDAWLMERRRPVQPAAH